VTEQCIVCGAYVEDAKDAVAAERQRWIEYVEWLTEQMAGAYVIAAVHGFKTPPDVIEEGRRRRIALGYTPVTHAY